MGIDKEKIHLSNIISRLCLGQDPKLIAKELDVTLGKVMRIQREYERDTDANLDVTHSKVIEAVDIVAAGAVRSGVAREVVEDIFSSNKTDMSKCLDGAALAIVSRVTQMAAFSPDLSVKDLDTLASTTTKLKLAFTETGDSQGMVTVESSVAGMDIFSDIMVD